MNLYNSSKNILFTDKDEMITKLLYNIMKKKNNKKIIQNFNIIRTEIIDKMPIEYIKNYEAHENKNNNVTQLELQDYYKIDNSELNSKNGFIKPEIYGLEFTYELYKYLLKKKKIKDVGDFKNVIKNYKDNDILNLTDFLEEFIANKYFFLFRFRVEKSEGKNLNFDFKNYKLIDDKFIFKLENADLTYFNETIKKVDINQSDFRKIRSLVKSCNSTCQDIVLSIGYIFNSKSDSKVTSGEIKALESGTIEKQIDIEYTDHIRYVMDYLDKRYNKGKSQNLDDCVIFHRKKNNFKTYKEWLDMGGGDLKLSQKLQDEIDKVKNKISSWSQKEKEIQDQKKEGMKFYLYGGKKKTQKKKKYIKLYEKNKKE